MYNWPIYENDILRVSSRQLLMDYVRIFRIYIRKSFTMHLTRYDVFISLVTGWTDNSK